jgi:hypothetical protein
LRLWKLLALVPVLGGCDLFSVETTIDDVCMQLDNRSIDGAPTQKLTRSFDYDQLAIFDSFISFDAQVTHLKVDLQGVSGVQDLSFLQSVHVSIVADGLPPLDVLACDDGECASDTLASSVEVAAPPNLVAYAMGGHVHVTVSVAGPLPPTAWVANLRVCMSGTAGASVPF